MKKLILIVCFLGFLSNSFAQTNVYHPFPDSNVVWNFERHRFCQFGSVDDHFSIMISGDTLINSQIYHKLTIPFIQTIYSGTCTPIDFSGYQGAIRQDTVARKVFIVPPSFSVEQLFYDFNLQIGDTIKGYLETIMSLKDTVISIDSVMVGNKYHKRWFINDWYSIYMIEGIGSTNGLLFQSPGHVTDYNVFTITCFQQNGQTLYPDTAINCPLITSINSVDETSNQIKVFPNPFSTTTQISFDKTYQTLDLSIIDLQGKIIQQKSYHDCNKITLDRAGIANGFYFLRVSLDGKFVETKKIAVTD